MMQLVHGGSLLVQRYGTGAANVKLPSRICKPTLSHISIPKYSLVDECVV